MGSAISTIADQASNEYSSLQGHERLEVERRRVRAERWYSDIVSEGLGRPIEFLRVPVPIEDGDLQPNQDARSSECTSDFTSTPGGV